MSRRINITMPDDVHDQVKRLAESGQADSVSGFITDAVRKSLAYARDAAAMNDLFGPPSRQEQELVEHLRSGGAFGDRHVA
jgi:Arc/MetJ-type ribon-helix-helix transcriptional regulator